MRRTVKIKLRVEETEKLEETIKQFKHACNQIAEEVWDENGLKTYNRNKLHKRTYQRIREQTGLVANHVAQATKRASKAIKSCVNRLKNGETVSKPCFSSDSIKYDKRTFSIWLDEKRATFSTIDGRIEAELLIPEKNSYYAKYMSDEWEITESTIEKHAHETGSPFYLHLGLKKEKELNNSQEPRVMGLDLGIDNLIVTSTGRFWSGNKLSHDRRNFRETRYKLQKKGTRSARLSLQSISGRENRYICDTLHRISREVVEHAENKGVDLIAMENLKEIRDRIPQKDNFQTWCFNKIYEYIKYKSEEIGIKVERIDPRYTSQDCSKCGYRSKESRKESNFRCVNCGLELHSDYNAAKNIGKKFLRDGQKSSLRKGDSKLALKSGTVTLKGHYKAYSQKS